jgi:hypothetical protein
MASSPKIGATALQAYARQGLAELRAAAPHAASPIAQPTDYGMPGVATPGEVTEARRDEQASPEHLDAEQIERAERAVERDERGIDFD